MSAVEIPLSPEVTMATKTKRASKKASASAQEVEMATETGGRSGMSKSEAVRQAIARGVTEPDRAVDFIRDEFGIVLGKQYFSSLKSKFKKMDLLRAGAPRKSPGRPRGSVSAAKAPNDLIRDLETIKDLIHRHGSDGVRSLITLLA
jgi:ribosomal protein S9